MVSSRILYHAQVPCISGSHSSDPEYRAGLELEAWCQLRTLQVMDLDVREWGF